MSTALFLPRYFELMRTAADTGLADSHSDHFIQRLVEIASIGPPFRPDNCFTQR
jgi:hypothetical protein